MIKPNVGALLLVSLLSAEVSAQNAGAVIAAASRAMGVEGLNSITYSGTARNGAFGQSKAIGEPLGTAAPMIRAPLAPTSKAAPVVTSGGRTPRVKLRTSPKRRPCEFSAIAQ